MSQTSAAAASSRLIIGPFNRVEGDLEVRLDIADGLVREARVTAPLYRGFETILQGRPPADALVIAPRICGICSVSQSTAAARALASLSGLGAPPNGRLAADLVLACENVADHLTHFALFFMPDFARSCYAGRPWFAQAHARFAANQGQGAAVLIAARARFLHIMGLLAGKWPHSLALQPGGTTKPVDTGERMRLLSILAEFREILETELFAAPLERIATLDGAAALDAFADEDGGGDFRLFLRIARDLGLERLGRGPGRFASAGSFGLFAAGLWADGATAPLSAQAIREDVGHAWLAGASAHPADGSTLPLLDKPDAYSWCKAPRLDGHAVEVGALARQMVTGHPLLRELAGRSGGTVRDRVVARLLEIALIVPAMESWARKLAPGEPFCVAAPSAASGAGYGLVEAARGMLGHWLELADERIARYQIIAPTTWNFSPRDDAGQPGPLETALTGLAVPDPTQPPVSVQHIVRSFDPCMVCTVH